MLQHELLYIYASHENAMSLPLIYGQNNTSLAIVIEGYKELSDTIFLASLAGQWFNSYWFYVDIFSSLYIEYACNVSEFKI